MVLRISFNGMIARQHSICLYYRSQNLHYLPKWWNTVVNDMACDMTVTQAESAATGGLNVSCVCMPITGWGRLPNGAEMVQYDAPMFFSFTEHSLLSQYPNMRAECHWHIDFEFTYIMRGHMWYFVNGETIRLDEGQGIFVNSRQLHYGFTKDNAECEFSCTLLNPTRMGAPNAVYERFIAPILADSLMPYIVFDADSEYGNALVDGIRRIHRAKFGCSTCNEHPALSGPVSSEFVSSEPVDMLYRKLWSDSESLTVLSCFYAMVRALTAFAEEREGDGSRVGGVDEAKIAALRSMIDYVQQHYHQRVTLAQIAAAGCVGRTQCAVLFHDMVGQSPIEFVNDVRVRAGAELLATTQLPVAEIAVRVGFSRSSFFARVFQRYMHVTPSAYRRSMRR